MLEENNICFPDGIYSYGDSFFNTIAPLYAKDFVKLDFPFYHYYQHPEQSVKRRNDKKIYDRIRVAERIVETCKERGIYDDFKSIIDDKWFSQMMGSAIDCISRFDVPNMEALYQIRALCKQRIPDYKKSCRSYRSYMLKSRAFFNLIMMSPKAAKIAYRIVSKVIKA